MNTVLKFIPQLLFLMVFFLLFGLEFGFHGNREELPLIYAETGILELPNDPYITNYQSTFNATTPYVKLLAVPVRILGREYTPLLFLGILVTMLFLTSTIIVNFLKKLSPTANNYQLFIGLLLLLILDRILYFQPDQRTVFWSYLDPESLAIPFFLGGIFWHWEDKFNLSIISFLICLIIHPLYGLLALGVLIITALLNGDRNWIPLIVPTLAFISYALLLFLTSKDYNGELSAAKIHEIIAFPYHLELPSSRTDKVIFHIRFFEWIGLTVFIGLLLNRYARFNKNQLLTLKVLGFSAVGLFFCVVVNQFFYLEFLIVSTPFRISNLLIILTVSILWSSAVNEHLFKPRVFDQKIMIVPLSILILGLYIIKNGYNASLSSISTSTTALMEAEAWGRKNLPPEGMILNYSNLRGQEELNQATYFESQFGFTENAQVDWYLRWRCYHAIPDSIPLNDYLGARNYKMTQRNIDVEKVLLCIEPKIDYLIVDKGQTHLIIPNNFPILFSNDTYQIYQIEGS